MVIASKLLSKVFVNLKSSQVFVRELLLLAVGILTITSVFLSLSFNEITILFSILALAILITLNFLGKQRNSELSRIKKIINAIRKNKFKTPDEIKLDNHLVELEGEIKSMFLRTQNDIANLKKLERVRTEFLGNVSHELRTPIFAIQGFLETLLNGAIDDHRVNRNFLEKANHHTNNLNTLLNELIDISMIESGKMHMSFRYFNVAEYLEQICNDLRPLADEKNLELVLYPIKEGLQLFGDRVRLKQVLVNLIQNSIKYTEKGKVEVLVEESKKNGKIIIKDTGIGISDADLDRIFERFYRVDKDRSREVGGTGLGLAIVKHIIEAHGSRIEVKSKVGEGSEFSFALKR